MTVDPRVVVADQEKAATEAKVLVASVYLAKATAPLHQQIADLQAQLAACEAGGEPVPRERPGPDNTGVEDEDALTVVYDHQPQTGGRYFDLDVRNVPQGKNGVTDVEYTNCIFRGTDTRPGGACGLYSLIRDTTAAGFTFRRCTFRPQLPDYRWVGMHGFGFHLFECDISGVADPVEVFRTDGQPDGPCEVIIDGCWFHDQAYFAPGEGGGETSKDGSHSDDVQWQGGTGLIIRWSYFTGMLGPEYQPGYAGQQQANAAIMAKPDAGIIGGGEITDNWFGGGAVTINIADAPTKNRLISDLGKIVRNHFYQDQFYKPTDVKINYAAGNTITVDLSENTTENGNDLNVSRVQIK
jgi:hypothetical protein